MQVIHTDPVQVIADEGMELTDGVTRAKHLWLGKNDSPHRWSEIPEGEEPMPDLALRATDNYEEGAYFEREGQLYLATKAIARGEAIDGTNATPVDVAQVLNDLEAKE